MTKLLDGEHISGCQGQGKKGEKEKIQRKCMLFKVLFLKQFKVKYNWIVSVVFFFLRFYFTL